MNKDGLEVLVGNCMATHLRRWVEDLFVGCRGRMSFYFNERYLSKRESATFVLTRSL
jgi:hypothetical protein